MTIELKILIGLGLHFVGDYLLQNDWLAANKIKNNLAAFIHATIYSLPFLFICNTYLWLIIYISHYLIDRYRLAVYWIKLVNWNWESKNFGFKEDKPLWMSVWLMITIDNVFHILINSVCIYLN